MAVSRNNAKKPTSNVRRGGANMKWPFGKKENEVRERREDEGQKNQAGGTPEEIFFRTINERRKEDPLIGAKIGAKEILNGLVARMKDDRGVHTESLLCALGALAGYSCQASLRKALVEDRGLSEQQVFAIVEAKNGSRYFFGDQINKPLAENPLSVWSLAAGAMQRLGINAAIDLGGIFKHVSETVGSNSFGVPRAPEGHQPADLPVHYVQYLWPQLLPTAKKYCASPSEWPIMFGLAVQEGIVLGKDVLDPLMALSIAMESAVPMAKADIAAQSATQPCVD